MALTKYNEYIPNIPNHTYQQIVDITGPLTVITIFFPNFPVPLHHRRLTDVPPPTSRKNNIIQFSIVRD